MVRKGPGTIIKETLEAYGFRATSGCPCNELAQEMNSVGPEQVMQNIDKYSERMQDSIRLWKKDVGLVAIVLPTPSIGILKEFISWACEKSMLS